MRRPSPASALAPAPESDEPAVRIAAVLKEVRPELARILARYRIPPLDSDDLVQDALVALLLKWPHVHHPAGWLPVTLRYLCLDYAKRRQRQAVAVDPQWLEELAGAASQQVDQDQRLDLQRLSRALPPRQQRLLWLAYGLGLSRRELAHELGRRAASVGRARQRAVARLRQLADGGSPSLKESLGPRGKD
jgi:RNA polymerase sigma factor (sigma-70 family)